MRGRMKREDSRIYYYKGDFFAAGWVVRLAAEQKCDISPSGGIFAILAQFGAKSGHRANFAIWRPKCPIFLILADIHSNTRFWVIFVFLAQNRANIHKCEQKCDISPSGGIFAILSSFRRPNMPHFVIFQKSIL